MHNRIGWAALVALTGCVSGPGTGSDVGHVTDNTEPSACELTGGTVDAPRAGADCGVQAEGDSCIWSPMAVGYGAQPAEATCGDRDCACVTLGNIHQACEAIAPSCTCHNGDLFVGEEGCADVSSLESSFTGASVEDLIGEDGVHLLLGQGIGRVAHYANLEALLEEQAWLSAGLRVGCELQRGTPVHDCDLGFGEKVDGCHLDASGDYAELSQRMSDLAEYAEQSYSEDDQIAAREIESRVVASVTLVEPKLKLYFGRDDEGWKLLVIDTTMYACGL